MKNIIREYDSIAIGSSLECLLYCYFNFIPVIFNINKKPQEFEFTDINDSFRFLFFNEPPKTLNSNHGTINIGLNKLEVWKRLAFALNLRGLMPLSGQIESIRIDEDLIKLTSKNSKLFKLKPKNILIFDDDGIEGLREPKQINTKYAVYDWMIFNSMRPHPFDIIYNESQFVKELWFVDSDKRRFKDGCAVSYCDTKEEVQNDLTDYALKFILSDTFKKHQITGGSNGYRPNGKPNILRVYYTFAYREIYKLYPNTYEDYDNIKFIYKSIPQILEEHPERSYKLNYICNRLSYSRYKQYASFI